MSAQLSLDLHARPESGKRFFQTTRLTADELADAIARATSQTESVLALYRTYGPMAPSEVHWRLSEWGVHALLTSVRRSITVLTKEGALRRTGRQVPGPWSAPESVWELRGPVRDPAVSAEGVA